MDSQGVAQVSIKQAVPVQQQAPLHEKDVVEQLPHPHPQAMHHCRLGCSSRPQKHSPAAWRESRKKADWNGLVQSWWPRCLLCLPRQKIRFQLHVLSP